MAEYRFPTGVTEEGLPARVRRFHRHFFVEVVDVVRGEADLDYLDDFSEGERQLALDLLMRNLTPPRSSILVGLARLGAEEAVPALLELLAQVEPPSRRIEIARCLTSITGDPDHLRGPLVGAMAPGEDATLKVAHFSDIRLLPPDEQLDLLWCAVEETAVFQVEDPVGQIDDPPARIPVEGGRRLVGQHQLGLVGERARSRADLRLRAPSPRAFPMRSRSSGSSKPRAARPPRSAGSAFGADAVSCRPRGMTPALV